MSKPSSFKTLIITCDKVNQLFARAKNILKATTDSAAQVETRKNIQELLASLIEKETEVRLDIADYIIAVTNGDERISHIYSEVDAQIIESEEILTFFSADESVGSDDWKEKRILLSLLAALSQREILPFLELAEMYNCFLCNLRKGIEAKLYKTNPIKYPTAESIAFDIAFREGQTSVNCFADLFSSADVARGSYEILLDLGLIDDTDRYVGGNGNKGAIWVWLKLLEEKEIIKRQSEKVYIKLLNSKFKSLELKPGSKGKPYKAITSKYEPELNHLLSKLSKKNSMVN